MILHQLLSIYLVMQPPILQGRRFWSQGACMLADWTDDGFGLELKDGPYHEDRAKDYWSSTIFSYTSVQELIPKISRLLCFYHKPFKIVIGRLPYLSPVGW